VNRLRALIGGLMIFAGQLIIPSELPLHPAEKSNADLDLHTSA
jgi:hypothetical protein